MKSLYKAGLRGLVAVIVALAVAHAASAQRLSVNELITLQAKSFDEVKSSLESKGWVYDGRCGGDDSINRYCFNAGDKGEGLAAVVYLEVNKSGDQTVEYTVFRQGLISQIQNNVRAAAMKLLRQESLTDNVKQRVYQKGSHVFISRGGVQQQYLSLKVQKNTAGTSPQMQASRK